MIPLHGTNNITTRILYMCETLLTTRANVFVGQNVSGLLKPQM
jgi:hypothetical protein